MLIHAVLATAVVTTGLNAQAASDNRISEAFGNTIVSTYPDGRSQRIWLHPDGSWNGVARNNTVLSGHWKVKDDKVCLKQSHPPTLPFSYCTPFPADARFGVAWPAHDFVGSPIQLSVMRGMTQADQRAEAAGATGSGLR